MQLKPGTLHRLDAEHILRYTASFTDTFALEMSSRLTKQLTHSNVPCSSISVIWIWWFRYVQLKPDTLHRLDAEHVLMDSVTLTSVKHPYRHGCPRYVKSTDQAINTFKCTLIDFGKRSQCEDSLKSARVLI